VVGTYRLLRGTVADSHNGYYSSNEFELDRLARYPGEHLELGRSCVDPAYRNKAAMQLLWRGIADYIQQHDVSLLFGCASFPGTDVRQMASALAFLYHNHAAPAAWRPQARAERYLPMDLMEKDDIDMRSAMREMPALIKGYLRLGGVVGDGLVLDHTFNTTDIFLLVESCNLTSRYARHFMDQRVPEASQLTS
jgi:putative hemolysin